MKVKELEPAVKEKLNEAEKKIVRDILEHRLMAILRTEDEVTRKEKSLKTARGKLEKQQEEYASFLEKETEEVLRGDNEEEEEEEDEDEFSGEEGEVSYPRKRFTKRKG